MAQGNRGKQLEKMVLKLFDQYRKAGIHCQQNHPEQLSDGTFIKRHGYDFHLYYKERFIVFDAKECKSTSMHIATNLKPHQLNDMMCIKKNGGEAFFMVYFFIDKVMIKLDIDEAVRLIDEGRKSITSDDGEKIKLNFLGL